MTADATAPSLLICTPSYDGRLLVPYTQSLLATIGELWAAGIWVNWTVRTGDSLLPMARNCLMAQALARPDWTHLLMIDADIEWRPEDVLRLLAHDLPFVTGLYASKTPEPALDYIPLADATPDPTTGLLAVDAAGCGFMLLKREVLTRLIEARPAAAISDAAGVYVSQRDLPLLPHLHDFFPLGFQDGVYTSEDFAFCRRWRAIGGKVLADLNVKLAHHGSWVYAIDPMRLLTPLPKVA